MSPRTISDAGSGSVGQIRALLCSELANMSAVTGEEDVCPLVSSGISPSETSLLVQEVLLDLVPVRPSLEKICGISPGFLHLFFCVNRVI